MNVNQDGLVCTPDFKQRRKRVGGISRMPIIGCHKGNLERSTAQCVFNITWSKIPNCVGEVLKNDENQLVSVNSALVAFSSSTQYFTNITMSKIKTVVCFSYVLVLILRNPD